MSENQKIVLFVCLVFAVVAVASHFSIKRDIRREEARKRREKVGRTGFDD